MIFIRDFIYRYYLFGLDVCDYDMWLSGRYGFRDVKVVRSMDKI